MKKQLVVITALLLLTHVHAQKKRTVFYAMPQAVLLNGDNYVSGQALLSVGAEGKKYSVGLGAGVDYYKLRTIPVFLESRFALYKRMFMYCSAGPGFAWALATQKSTHYLPNGATSVDEFSVGVNADAGLGYKIPVNKSNMLISLGYSLKTVRQSYQEAIYIGTFPSVPAIVGRKLDYALNRIALRVGLTL